MVRNVESRHTRGAEGHMQPKPATDSGLNTPTGFNVVHMVELMTNYTPKVGEAELAKGKTRTPNPGALLSEPGGKGGDAA